MRAVILLGAAIAVGAGTKHRLPAEAESGPFSMEQVLSYPFTENLIASPAGSTIAWTFNERGVRNIYAADAPDYTARRVTPYKDDDGQELTNLTFSSDGRTIVYVRGGDHGANWAADGNLMPNPASSAIEPKMQVWSVPVAGGNPRLLGEGDDAAVAPHTNRVAFVKDRKIWIVPLDGSKPAEVAFFAKGSSESPTWSPDGETLAFVSDRDDHSFIGLFTDASHPIRYIAASTSRDALPQWSPDDRRIAFVRLAGRGGVPRSPLVQQPVPWTIWVGDPSTLSAREVWKSGDKPVDSLPRTQGGPNLHWGAGDLLVFLSYQDGWPHLYSVPAAGGSAKLLTPGKYMVEDVTITPDRKFALYNANGGTDRDDIDRRHIFKVPVDAALPLQVTSGRGLEWQPVATADGKAFAFVQSDAQRPSQPAVFPLDGRPVQTLADDHLPKDFPLSKLVTPEPVIIRSSDGLEIHGQLFKAAANGDARRPALVYVHGGPPRQMLLGWHYMYYYSNDYAANQYLASHGFVVLSVNYRLGIGYGFAFHNPERAGARGASEYLDVIAAGRYLQNRSDVDPKRIGIWGGSYGGYLTALALGRNSDVFAAGVDIHGVHNWDRQGRAAPDVKSAMAGDGITEADLKEAARVTFESSPVSSVPTWKSPVLLIHADDDRNVEFHQTVDLKQRLVERGVKVDEIVIPDDIHDFLLWRSWLTVTTATGRYFEQVFFPR